jgi:hypothetical protein
VISPELAARLLEHARGQAGTRALGYAKPPTAISGGYDTQVFGFQLAGAPPEWSAP